MIGNYSVVKVNPHYESFLSLPTFILSAIENWKDKWNSKKKKQNMKESNAVIDKWQLAMIGKFNRQKRNFSMLSNIYEIRRATKKKGKWINSSRISS